MFFPHSSSSAIGLGENDVLISIQDTEESAGGINPALQGIKIVNCDTHLTEAPDLFTARAPATAVGQGRDGGRGQALPRHGHQGLRPARHPRTPGPAVVPARCLRPTRSSSTTCHC